MPENTDYDVIVVGAGNAGLAAALMADAEGARTLLVDAGKSVGGSSVLSGGVFYAAGTSVQEAAGIRADTPESMFRYYMALNQYRVNAAVVHTLCMNAGHALEWLIQLGVKFPTEDLYVGGVSGVPRSHKPEGFGASIIAALDAKASNGSIDIVLNTKVEKLLQDEFGRVLGIQSNGDRVTASSVVLTTGGFGPNLNMRHRYYPESTKAGRLNWSISADTCQGDGLMMGEEAGADIVGFNRGLLLCSPGFHHHLESKMPPWLALVNREGHRFVNETAAYAVMSGVVGAQTGGTAFGIFDEAARSAARPDPEAADAGHWVGPVLEEQVKKGTVLHADTWGELAAKAGINAPALQHTVEEYNADCEKGVDTAFLKKGEVTAFKTAPFYAVEVRPTIIALTSVGLRIDPQARVRGNSGAIIPGLYSAGETTGDVLGERYIGSGNAVANAVTYGRIAGVSAARAASG